MSVAARTNRMRIAVFGAFTNSPSITLIAHGFDAATLYSTDYAAIVRGGNMTGTAVGAASRESADESPWAGE